MSSDRTYNSDPSRQICTFFSKIGACRHGDKCVRTHIRPKHSKTVAFLKLYDNPKHIKGLRKQREGETETDENKEPLENSNNGAVVVDQDIDEAEVQKKLDHMYKDVFVELALKYGPIERMTVCENVNNHLSGNVYVKFKDEHSAADCYKSCNDRWYNNRPIFAELSPVTNLDDATCRLYEQGECDRGGLCNFIHIRRPSSRLERELFSSQRKYLALKETEEF